MIQSYSSRLLGCLIFMATFFFFSNHAKASHLVGAEISYVCEGSGIFTIYVKVYRDCNGIQVSQSTIVVTSGGTTLYLSNQTKVSVSDVTGLNSDCPIKSSCSGSFPYGFEEHVWKATLDLSTFNSCDWTISWQQSARSNNITTGPASQNFHIESKLNKCLDICNSSPVMLKAPLFLACRSEEYNYSFFAKDTVDGDSLSYHLVPALQYPNQAVIYGSGFTASRPLTFRGFPNQNLPKPEGLRLNAITGVLDFTPAKGNEIAVIVIEVREWRKINGVMTQIGSVVRDFQLVVIPCTGNSTPGFADSITDYYTCAESDVCFDIRTVDPNISDTTFLEIMHEISGAEDSITADSNRAKGSFCWKPTVQDVREEPYHVFARIKDNGCPFPGVKFRVYNIYVWQNDATIDVDTTTCSDIILKAQPAGAYPNVTYEWSASKNGSSEVVSTQMTDTVTLANGSYKITLQMSTAAGCIKTFDDSVTVQGIITVDLGSDTSICRNSNFMLDAGSGYSSYKWNVGGNTQTISVNDSGVYSVEVEDARGCKASDEVLINVLPLPDSSFSIQDMTLRNFVFSAADTAGVSYAWDFGDGNTADTNPAAWQYAAEDSFVVTLTVTDSLTGCTNTSLQQLIIAKTIKATIEVDTAACGDVILKAIPAEPYPNVTYTWLATRDGNSIVVSSKAVDTVKLASGSYKISMEISSIIGTKIYHDSVTVPNLVTVDLGSDTTICKDPNFMLDAGAGYSSYKWNVGGNGQTTPVSDSGLYSVEVEDILGCKASDEVLINVLPLPDSSFSMQDLTSRNFIFSAADTSGVSYAWDFGDGNTADTNPAAWQYAVEDSYTVTLKVTDSITGCTNTSSQQLLISNIQQLHQSGISAKLYPNPAGDELSLDLELQEAGEISISVIDIKGRTVIGEEKHNCSSGELKKSLDVSTLASGFYAVKIGVNGQVPVLVKFVKQ